MAKRVLDDFTGVESQLDQMDKEAIVIKQTLNDPTKATVPHFPTYFRLFSAVRESIPRILSNLDSLRRITQQGISYKEIKSLEDRFIAICIRQHIAYRWLNGDILCTLWMYNELMQSQLNELEGQEPFGYDIATVERDLEFRLEKHEGAQKLKIDVDKWLPFSEVGIMIQKMSSRSIFNSRATALKKLQHDLLYASQKRLDSLKVLLDIYQSSTDELDWIKEKISTEISRDFTGTLQEYHNFESEAKRRIGKLEQMLRVGESFVGSLKECHPIGSRVTSLMAEVKSKMDLLSKLKLCWKNHLLFAGYYLHFNYMTEEYGPNKIHFIRERLNNLSCKVALDVEEAKEQLQDLQFLQESLIDASIVADELFVRRYDVVPLWKRRRPVESNIEIVSIGDFRQGQVAIQRGEICQLVDNAPNDDHAWQIITSNGVKCRFPSFCFTILPTPDGEAIAKAVELKDHCDANQTLWSVKQLLLRESVRVSIETVVKGLNLDYLATINKDELRLIREKLIQLAEKLNLNEIEGVIQLLNDAEALPEVSLDDGVDDRLSPLSILQLCEEFLILCDPNTEVLQRAALRSLTLLYTQVETAEQELSKILANFPKEISQLTDLRKQRDHKGLLGVFKIQLECLLKRHQDVLILKIESCPRVTSSMREKYNHCVRKSNILRAHFQLTVDGFDATEKMVRHLYTAGEFVSQLEDELKLTSSEPEHLHKVYNDLVIMQSNLTEKQRIFDELSESLNKVQQLIDERNMEGEGIGMMGAHIKAVIRQWNKSCSQLNEWILTCEKTLKTPGKKEEEKENLKILPVAYLKSFFPIFEWLWKSSAQMFRSVTNTSQ